MLGGVSIYFEGCSEDYLYFSFLLSLDTLSSCTPVLRPPLIYDIHCIYFSFIYMMMYVVSHLSPSIVFFLSLYTHFLMYAIFYFCFILRCLDEFCLKCFRKTGCQNLSCHELSSCKVFQELVLGLDFIVFNKWLWV